MDLNHIADKEHYTSDFGNYTYNLRPDFPLGVVLLDLDEKEVPRIATRVVDKLISYDQVPIDQREAVIRILLHKHNSSQETSSTEEKPNLGGRRRSSVRKLPVPNNFPQTDGGNTTDEPNGVVSNGTIPKDLKSCARHNSFTEIEIDENVLFKNKEAKKKSVSEGGEMTAVMAGGVSFLESPILAFVRLSEGVVLQDLIEVSMPVRFIFVLLGPFHDEKDYHEIGHSISTLMASKVFREAAYTANTRDKILIAANEVLPPVSWTANMNGMDVAQIMKKRESIMMKSAQCEEAAAAAAAAMAAASPGEGDDGDKKPPTRDPLIRIGKPFYGLYLDIRDRYPKYPSDIIDGFSGQVAAATIFIFFAALSPAITFGGMYGDMMDNYIGVGECLLMSSVNGAIFALFAAQPLLIVGATGPLMVFDMSLYQFAKTNELDFLAMRVWIGLWMTIIGLLVSATEAVALVRKFTRFTEEIFATLVCLIFIYEAVSKTAGIFVSHPLLEEYGCGDDILPSPLTTMDDFMNGTEMSINGTAEVLPVKKKIIPQPNTALLSLILMLGTFVIAIKLKYFRNSKYLGRSARRALGDFGVPIAIVLMVALDYVIKHTYTDKLTMPEGIQPSNPKIRGWFINPFGQEKPLPVWCMFAGAPASILVFFLVFLEENICHLILSKPERKLVKGTGFHWDLLLSCFINFLSGLLGAPYMGPACVRTVAHASALTVTAPGPNPGDPPQIAGVREQRVSSLVVSILVGLAVLLSDALNLVPKAVLFGVFLYMGIASTAGIHFLERTVLMFMPVKYHPDMPYVKKVRTLKMHIFTVIQLTALGVCWGVKESPAALALPFVLILLIPIRLYLLPFIFTKPELSALDGTEAMKTDDTDEPDFYEAQHALPTDADHDHQS
ncbi:LOW QUALITY PROTEIN: anion exchange protein 2 [Procambarus clarkii]|uniref:LOW QUALITY PROTEIN: anion exchange protein 2 n=1 Tax=Procambarus clarkii TaxID=6728 RepID=UPI001E6731F5|nr:anion exchange protein 2-like isoform X2 [Procambarus clarkii]